MTTNSTVTSTSQGDKGAASPNANDQAELQEVIRISPTFRALSKDHIDVLIRTARIEHLPADRVVLREGDKSERLYLILKGDVEAFWGSSLREIISRVTRGGVFGTVFEGEPSYCSFATSRTTLVASWDEATLRQAELRAPGLSFQLEVRLSKEKRLPEFNELLQHASLFRNTSQVLRQRLLHEMTLLQLPAGASIYQEGDSANACYLIVSGEVDVAQPASAGHEARSTRFERGGVFGESDLLASGKRTEAAVATLDTELLAIDRIDVEALRRACGSFRNTLFGRISPSATRAKAQDLILVVNSTPHSTRSIAALFPTAFADIGESDALVVEVAPEGYTGPGSDKALLLPSDPARAIEVLDAYALRAGNRYLILHTMLDKAIEWLAEPVWDKIIDNRVSAAVYFTDDVRRAFPIETPQLAPVQYVEVRSSSSAADTHMVRSGTVRLIVDGARGSDLQYGSLSAANRMSLQRLMRTLAHQAVGIALGGGAAWGYAHVALLRALHEAGIPIDMVAGTSIGSIVACAYGSRRLAGLDSMVDLGKELTLRLMLAPISRKPVEAFIESHFLEHRLLEDMPIPTLPVAVDIHTGRPRVFRHGVAAQAASMSSAMPAFFVPELQDGVRYVDGGVANNVPVSALVDEGADFIIASNIISAPNQMVREHHKSDFRRLISQISPFGRARDALRSMFLLMHDAGARQANAAQVTFAPSSLWKFDPFDFRTGPAIIKHVEPELPRFIELVKDRYRRFCQNRNS